VTTYHLNKEEAQAEIIIANEALDAQYDKLARMTVEADNATEQRRVEIEQMMGKVHREIGELRGKKADLQDWLDSLTAVEREQKMRINNVKWREIFDGDILPHVDAMNTKAEAVKSSLQQKAQGFLLALEEYLKCKGQMVSFRSQAHQLASKLGEPKPELPSMGLDQVCVTGEVSLFHSQTIYRTLMYLCDHHDLDSVQRLIELCRIDKEHHG
jgi:chromosome segregation ATPase